MKPLLGTWLTTSLNRYLYLLRRLEDQAVSNPVPAKASDDGSGTATSTDAGASRMFPVDMVSLVGSKFGSLGLTEYRS
jgi:hypothetical protein